VRFSSGDLAELNAQKEVAREAIGGAPFYLDGTSALMLSEHGLLEVALTHLPGLKVPQSVIAVLFTTKDKFSYRPGQTGHMSFAQGKLIFSSADPEIRSSLQANFNKGIQLLESKPERIEAISGASKLECLSEQRVPPELCDACILAQQHSTPVLTEDFLYLKANELETKKKAPAYFSSFALVRVLYEQGKITFNQYLNYYSFLSTYRFRFLPVTSDDIEKAVFGGGTIAAVHPARVQLLNFPLTLSEAYGVPFRTAFIVVGKFLVKVLIDDTVIPETAEKIFAEIVSSFPTDKDRKMLGRLLIRESAAIIDKMREGLIIGLRAEEKIAMLKQFVELYSSNNKLWIPL
jgi:hypothetical protein